MPHIHLQKTLKIYSKINILYYTKYVTYFYIQLQYDTILCDKHNGFWCIVSHIQTYIHTYTYIYIYMYIYYTYPLGNGCDSDMTFRVLLPWCDGSENQAGASRQLQIPVWSPGPSKPWTAMAGLYRVRHTCVRNQNVAW